MVNVVATFLERLGLLSPEQWEGIREASVAIDVLGSAGGEFKKARAVDAVADERRVKATLDALEPTIAEHRGYLHAFGALRKVQDDPIAGPLVWAAGRQARLICERILHHSEAEPATKAVIYAACALMARDRLSAHEVRDLYQPLDNQIPLERPPSSAVRMPHICSTDRTRGRGLLMPLTERPAHDGDDWR